jgi:hypothetical protein
MTSPVPCAFFSPTTKRTGAILQVQYAQLLKFFLCKKNKKTDDEQKSNYQDSVSGSALFCWFRNQSYTLKRQSNEILIPFFDVHGDRTRPEYKRLLILTFFQRLYDFRSQTTLFTWLGRNLFGKFV